MKTLTLLALPFTAVVANDNHVATDNHKSTREILTEVKPVVKPAPGLMKGHGNTKSYFEDGDTMKIGDSYWSYEKYMSS